MVSAEWRRTVDGRVMDVKPHGSDRKDSDGRTVGRSNSRTVEWTEGLTDGRMNERRDGRTEDGQTDEPTDVRTEAGRWTPHPTWTKTSERS